MSKGFQKKSTADNKVKAKYARQRKAYIKKRTHNSVTSASYFPV